MPSTPAQPRRKLKILLMLELRRLFCVRKQRRRGRIKKEDEKYMRYTQRGGFAKHADNDVWIQRHYTNSDGIPVYFWSCYGTGRCVLFEPPSDATLLVHLEELETKYAHLPELKAFAYGPLDQDQLHEMEMLDDSPIITTKKKVFLSIFFSKFNTRRCKAVQVLTHQQIVTTGDTRRWDTQGTTNSSIYEGPQLIIC